MRRNIPATLIAALSDVIPAAETHATLNRLFLHAGAPGDPPEGNKQLKVQDWLRQTNRHEGTNPLAVLGKLLEPYMEADGDAADPIGQTNRERRVVLERALGRAELQYARGGLIVGALGPASETLEELIRGRNILALDQEFRRALGNVEGNPREAVSAACNILESVCKVYIHDEALTLPAKQDLQGVWGVVRRDLNFDPSVIEDNDLKSILSGLLGVVSGIGALRTHASSAHGAGRKSYRLEPRHARLAVHAAHTVVAFVLESWDKKRGARTDAPTPGS